MSSLQGYVTASYAALVREFGEPGPPDDPDKSHLLWQPASPYVGAVTIYDYGPCHDCDGTWHISMIEPIEWHVGGDGRAAIDWVARRLWVEPHYPFHAGCCRPPSRPWWIEERDHDDDPGPDSANADEAGEASAESRPADLPPHPDQLPLIGP